MARTTSTDLQTTDDAAVDVASASFADLSEGADETQSLDIADKANLLGVPFIITRVTLNPSDKGDRDFVSCEITTQNNERFVLNDGSTGVRRDVVKYLTAKGYINPGEGEDNGKTTRFDNNVSMWDVKEGDIRFDEQGDAHYEMNGLRLLCKRGLRRSDYRNEHGEGTTYYLA